MSQLDFSAYQLEDTVSAELNNNLTLVDLHIGTMCLNYRPEFYILGGAALVFYKLDYNVTLDIDIANEMDERVSDYVSPFISDNASEVATIAVNYRQRAERFRSDLKFIDVYLLSYEDLFITKLATGRPRDIKSLCTSGIYEKLDLKLLMQIINTEFFPTTVKRILTSLTRFRELREVV